MLQRIIQHRMHWTVFPCLKIAAHERVSGGQEILPVQEISYFLRRQITDPLTRMSVEYLVDDGAHVFPVESHFDAAF